MLGAIKPLGDLVTTLPAGPEYPGRTAGPSFELFYESDYVLPHRQAAWILLTERLEQAADFCEPGVPCDPGVADGLAAVRSTLAAIAQSLAAHLPAGIPGLAGPPAPAGDLPTLLAQADHFHQTVLGVTPSDDPVLAGLTALATSAYQTLRATPGDARTVARLVNSVLRPLTALLSPHQPQAPQEPLPPQQSPPSLWDLAVTATHLRAAPAPTWSPTSPRSGTGAPGSRRHRPRRPVPARP